MTRKAAVNLSVRQAARIRRYRNEVKTLRSLVSRVFQLDMPHLQDGQILRDIKRGMKAIEMDPPSKLQTMRSRGRS